MELSLIGRCVFCKHVCAVTVEHDVAMCPKCFSPMAIESATLTDDQAGDLLDQAIAEQYGAHPADGDVEPDYNSDFGHAESRGEHDRTL